MKRNNNKNYDKDIPMLSHWSKVSVTDLLHKNCRVEQSLLYTETHYIIFYFFTLIIRSTYISLDTSLADGLILPSNGPISLATGRYVWNFSDRP